jgi:hypothetical protein
MGGFFVMLTAESILQADDCSDIEKVEVPEWGGFLFVKVMNGAERDFYELTASKSIQDPGSGSIRAVLCAATICNDQGDRMFTNKQVGELSKKSGHALDRVFTVAQRVNKITDDEIEDLEKNS